MMSLPFASGGSTSSRPFEARFPGICENCGDGFETGDSIMYEGDDLVHADPDDCRPAPPVRAIAPCSSCFLVHAGDCF